MTGGFHARVGGIFIGLGMAVVVAAHVAFLAAVAAATVALLPIGLRAGVLFSSWAMLAFYVAGLVLGGALAARGGAERWWLAGLAVGTLGAGLAIAVVASFGGLPSETTGGVILGSCELAALVGAALGSRFSAPAESSLIGRLLATDAFLLFGAVLILCLMIAAGYPGHFRNLTSGEAWVFALLSCIPALAALMALRVTGGLRRCLLRRPTGIAALVLLVGFAAALVVRAEVNRHSMASLDEATAAFNAAHAPADTSASENILKASEQAKAADLLGGEEDRILLMRAGWDARTEPEIAGKMAGLQKRLDDAVRSAKSLSGYLPLTADFVMQSVDAKRSSVAAFALVQALCASALRAGVDYPAALARLDAAERIAIATTPQAALARACWIDEDVVLVSLKELLASRQLDAKDAHNTLALLAQWDKRRQTGAETWGALARLAALASGTQDYARTSQESVVSYVSTFWLPPAGLQAGVNNAIAAFARDIGCVPPARIIQRYGPDAYLKQITDQAMNAIMACFGGHEAMSIGETQDLQAESASIGSVTGGLAEWWEDGARLRLLAAALAMRLEEERTGKLPDGLDALTVACPVPLQDPFSSGLLSVTVRDGQTVVFSVGPDGRPDGGGVFSLIAQPQEEQSDQNAEQSDDIALPLDSLPALAH